jgi:hypothetical protein
MQPIKINTFTIVWRQNAMVLLLVLLRGGGGSHNLVIQFVPENCVLVGWLVL